MTKSVFSVNVKEVLHWMWSHGSSHSTASLLLTTKTPNGLECQLYCRLVFEIYLVLIPRRSLAMTLFLWLFSSNSVQILEHYMHRLRKGYLPINFQLIIILLIDTTHSEPLKLYLKGKRQNQFPLYTSKRSYMECGVMAPHILLHHYSGNTILIL